MNKHVGSCLCGEVLFEIIGDFERFPCVAWRLLGHLRRARSSGRCQ